MARPRTTTNFILLVSVFAIAVGLHLLLSILSLCNPAKQPPASARAHGGSGRGSIVLPRQLADTVHLRGGSAATVAAPLVPAESLEFLDARYRDALWKAVTAVAGNPALHATDAAGLADVLGAAVQQLLEEAPVPRPPPVAPSAAHAVPLADGTPSVDDRLTHQSCFMHGDESELCTYEGTLCYDGERVVAVTNEPLPAGPLAQRQSVAPAMPSGCEDTGAPSAHSHEKTVRCRYRAAAAGAVGATTLLGPLPHPGSGAPSLPFVLASPWEVFPSPQEGWDGVHEDARAAAAGAPAPPLAGGLRVLHRATIKPPRYFTAAASSSTSSFSPADSAITVDYVDGALWLVPLPAGAAGNAYEWAASVTAPLFAAQRANASGGWGAHPLDGWVHPPREGPSFVGQAKSIISVVDALVQQREHTAQHGAAAAAAAAAAGGVAPVRTPQPLARQFPAEAAQAHPGERPLDPGSDLPSWDASPLPLESGNTARWVIGPQWGPLPPMDAVLFTGPGDAFGGAGAWLDLPPAANGTLALASQHHTAHLSSARVFQRSAAAAAAAAGGAAPPPRGRHLVCARRAVLPGRKPRVHSDYADAWMWRQYAYQATGLAQRGVLSHAMYPPRRITIVGMQAWAPPTAAAAQAAAADGVVPVLNFAELEAAARATGLEVAVLPRLPVQAFAAQVAQLAATGIVIAPHAPGAMLAAATLPPAHAVVIEVFPPGVRNDTFRKLTAQIGAHHYPLYTRAWLPLPGGSGADARASPLVLPMRHLRRLLDDAIDAIGAYSRLNPAWAEHAASAQLPPPTRLAYIAADPDGEETEILRATMDKGRALAAEYNEKAAAAAAAAAAATATAA